MSLLPILMYHNIVSDSKKSKGLNISVEKLEEQFNYLVENNYESYHISELKNHTKIASKSVVLTFDDVTKNQLQYAVPLLLKYNLKATFFIPFKYIGGYDDWNNSSEPIMTLSDLKALPSNIELGHHSFAHKNFSTINVSEIEADFKDAEKFINDNQIKLSAILAYPYGKYPKDKQTSKDIFFKILKQYHIEYAFRIGNRVNKFPFKNPYEIMRIDVKGDDSLFKFKLKLKFGKLKLF